MHKSWWWILPGLLLAIAISHLPGTAGVTGVCSNCHTMHNSEQGTVVAFELDSTGDKVIREEPFEMLLRTNCAGCHTHAGPETIVIRGETRVPIILNLTEPTYPPDGSSPSTLSGGNFYWLLNGGDQYGHNVYGIAGDDSRFDWAPGGVERLNECRDCHGTLATPQSGCTACHVPHHHAYDQEEVTGREGGWYRFLGSVMQWDGTPEPTPEGVIGIEDPDWEQNPLATNHNVYQGKPGPYLSYLESGAIGQKCAGCHGIFHQETEADNAWIRHPADRTLPGTGEFADYTVYDPLAPVARPNVSPEDKNFSQINHDSDLVTCISCHRPHGTPYPAMLRWGYRDWPGNDSHTGQPAVNGCAVCHTTKD